jgi:predicted amidophosphoribosyltransferase
VNCASCGRENRADAAFCDGCGAGLTRGCENCGRELRAGARGALEQAHRSDPNLSEDHVRKACAFWDPDVLERYIVPLRKAG